MKTLEKFHAIARVERNDFDFSLKLRKPELPEPAEAENRRKAVIVASRAKYATPRAEVEAALQAGMRIDRPKPPSEALPLVAPLPKPPPLPVQPSVTQPLVEPLSQPPIAPLQVSGILKDTVSEKKAPEPPRDLGRGGAQHKAIQQRIKKAAEELGFRSIIEKLVLDGLGSIDLLLERGVQTIACETSISTTVDHEVGNVSKCLKAGFSEVAVICLDDERLRKIREAVTGSLGKEETARVVYFTPDDFISHLKSLQPPTSTPSETEYAGYKIKRSAPARSPKERLQKEDIANRVIAEAMRKKKP